MKKESIKIINFTFNRTFIFNFIKCYFKSESKTCLLNPNFRRDGFFLHDCHK